MRSLLIAARAVSGMPAGQTTVHPDRAGVSRQPARHRAALWEIRFVIDILRGWGLRDGRTAPRPAGSTSARAGTTPTLTW